VATGTPAAKTDKSTLGIQYIGASTFSPFNGRLDDARLWARALSPGDVRQVYVDSIAGSPRTLRRIDWSNRWVDSAGAGGGFKSAWARNSNTIIQPLVTA
jgi:hypothetical protein